MFCLISFYLYIYIDIVTKRRLNTQDSDLKFHVLHNHQAMNNNRDLYIYMREEFPHGVSYFTFFPFFNS